MNSRKTLTNSKVNKINVCFRPFNISFLQSLLNIKWLITGTIHIPFQNNKLQTFLTTFLGTSFLQAKPPHKWVNPLA